MFSTQDFIAMRQALAGLFAGGGGYRLYPFTYNIDFVTPNQLASLGTTTLSFQSQADSAFVIFSTQIYVTQTTDIVSAQEQPFGSGATTAGLGILCTLTDTGSGRTLMPSGIPVDSIFGTGQFPYKWPVPYVLMPTGTIQATLQNIQATAWHVRLAFAGFKVFGNIQNYLKQIGVSV